MNIPLSDALDLLHRCGAAVLATHSREPEGFPYPTLLPYALDAGHQPVILISRLAEHTRNLLADRRAGLLVSDTLDGARAGSGAPLAEARLTAIGEFEPVLTEVDLEAVTRRYLRYQPDAERYLALGDFRFYRLRVRRLRYIGGFGVMGWLERDALCNLPTLPEEIESALIAACAGYCPRHVKLIGIDPLGADLTTQGVRSRVLLAQTDAPENPDPQSDDYKGNVLLDVSVIEAHLIQRLREMHDE